MGLQHSVSSIVSDRLLFNLDATNPRSYDGKENLLRYSEDFSNSAWIRGGDFGQIGITNIAPPGQGANAFLWTAAGMYPLIAQSPISVTTGQVFTYSFYAKYVNQRYVTIVSEDGWGGGSNYDLINAIPSDATNGSMQALSDGWYRCSFKHTIPAGITVYRPQIRLGAYDGTNYLNSQVYIWGAQLETGSTLTAYTKTTNSAITRTWYDLTDNQYNALLTNNPTYTNGVMQFRATGQNLTNQYGTITIDEGILRPGNKTKSWTLEALFRYVSAPGNSEAGIIAREGCNSGIYINTDNTLDHAIKTDQCWTGAPTVRLATLTAGTYYHTVMVYNAGTITSYLNGVQVGTASLNLNIYDIFPHATPLHIGGIRTLYSTNADINIARGYSKALTAAEVSQNFQSVRGRFGL
jgi:hypothetical protein